AAKRENAAARPADVPEQELDDRRRPDVLDADRVLCPADRVDERRGALAAGVPAKRLGHAHEVLGRAAADLGDDLGRVPAIVLLQELEDAARVSERRIRLRRVTVLERATVRAVAGLLAGRRPQLALSCGGVDAQAGVLPRRRVIRARLRVPAGEEAVEIL